MLMTLKELTGSKVRGHILAHMRKQGASEDEVKAALANAGCHNLEDTSLFHYCDKCDKGRFLNDVFIGRGVEMFLKCRSSKGGCVD